MKTIPFTEAQNGLKAVVDNVIHDFDATVVTRSDSEDAVVMSLNSYNSLIETAYLLRSSANSEHLHHSITQYKSGQATERALIGD